MQHPYSVLRPEYERDLATMKVDRSVQVDRVARHLLHPDIMDKHRLVQDRTGVPAVFIATLFEREASSNFHLALGQGDPWNRVSTHVPRGKGPFPSWPDAAIYYVKYDHINDNSAPWSLPYMCWKGEIWNGFGPRGHGRPTGYLWSGTTIYDPPAGPGGKYIADGQWSGHTVDQQLGIMPVILRMLELDKSLGDYTVTHGVTLIPPAAPLPVPVGVGGGTHDTLWVQHALNDVAHSGIVQIEGPLREDGNYGRRTREAVRAYQRARNIHPVDGLAGPVTNAALEVDLAKVKES